jgi:hypothetical protein
MGFYVSRSGRGASIVQRSGGGNQPWSAIE